MSSPFPESELIARACGGNVDAFDQLIQHYQGLAYSVAYRTLQDGAAADDAVQESVIKAWRALGQYHGGSFKSWLMRIVVNTCYDVLRSSHYRNTESLDGGDSDDDYAPQYVDAGEQPHDFAERAELNGWIEEGIRSLPADQRMVLVLCDVHGYAYDEIASIIDQPMGTVKSRISRARARLRDYLLRRPELLPSNFRPRNV